MVALRFKHQELKLAKPRHSRREKENCHILLPNTYSPKPPGFPSQEFQLQSMIPMQGITQ